MKPIRYWVGGSACAGKTTLARRFAAERGYRFYSCDEAFGRHLALHKAERQPSMHLVASAAPGELFGSRSVAELLGLYLNVFREDVPFVLGDLDRFEAEPVVAEGNQLLPELLVPLLSSQDRAVWIVPTEAFQREQYTKREWVASVLAGADDPAAAYDRWMQRDARFAEEVIKQAQALGLPVLLVDGSKSLEENYLWLAGHFR